VVPSLILKKDLFLSILQDNKKKLRKEYKRGRDAFVGQLDAASRNLVFRIAPSPLRRIIEQSNVIAVYSSIGSEAPTSRLIEYLTEQGKTLAFPVTLGKQPLIFKALSNIELLASGYQNIPEPPDSCPVVKPDVIITPMIAFDRSMGRLGQGGGHYDRTFEKYPDAVRVGLAWSVQEVDAVPVEAHDMPLHMIVTESEIIQQDSLTP